MLDYLVPDRFFGGISFEDACKKHDACYNESGIDKSTCDENLFDNIDKECKRVEEGDSDEKMKNCRRLRDIYYNAVDSFGGQWYKKK